MLESLVSNLINKLFGKYIENLDASKLKKIKLLNFNLESDVVFENLTLKPTVLDSFIQFIPGKVPVKVTHGHIRELILKIPWAKLSSAPTYVHVRDFHVLVVPSDSVSYCKQEKEAARQAKKRELADVEAANNRKAADQVDKDKKASTSLSGKIIKNLHLTVENLHIRYEDDSTYPGHPFAAGLTLEKLILETENEDVSLQQNNVSESSKKFRKVISLDNLAFYWLVNVKLFRYSSRDEWLQQFSDGISTRTKQPYENSCVVRPMTCRLTLVINSHRQLDGSNFTIPKMFAKCTITDLVFDLSPQQLATILRMLDFIQWMEKSAPYRKYRPRLEVYSQHAPEWWQFAYTCVVEEIRSRRKQWEWDHIKGHLATVREYVDLYACKLSQYVNLPELKQKLTELEGRLDVFNIIQARSRAEIKVRRMKKEMEKRHEAERKTFFNKLLGVLLWGSTDKEEELTSTFETPLTSEEKGQLLAAIDYEGNSAPVYPKEHISTRVEFLVLAQLTILLRSASNLKNVIFRADFSHVQGAAVLRAVAKVLELSVTTGSCYLNGSPLQDSSIVAIEPLGGSKKALCFDAIKNPMDDGSPKMLKLDISSLSINLQREALLDTIQHVMNDFIDLILIHKRRREGASSTSPQAEKVTPVRHDRKSIESIIQMKTCDLSPEGESIGMQLDVDVELLKIEMGSSQSPLAEATASFHASVTTASLKEFDFRRVDFQLRRLSSVLYPKHLELVHFMAIPGRKPEQYGNEPSVRSYKSRQNEQRRLEKKNVLTLSLDLLESEIFLLEDDSVNTNALVVSMATKVDFHRSVDMELTASISKLCGYSCVFNRARREDSAAEFLSPFSAEITCKQPMDERASAIFVDISASNIPLTLSPGTYSLISNIVNNLKSSKTPVPDEEKSTVKTYPDLWKVKFLREMNLPFLNASVNTRSRVKEWNRKSELHLNVAIEGITVVLETTTNGMMLPLVLVESDLTLQVTKLFSGLDIQSSLQLQATYYNRIVSLWEPVVEPNVESQDGSGRSTPWKLNFTLQQSEETRGPTRISIESTDTLEVTVTKEFLDVVWTIVEDFGRATKQQLPRREALVEIYTIKNDLDVNILLDLAASELAVASISDGKESQVILSPLSEISLKAPISSQAHSVKQVCEKNSRKKIMRVRFNDINSQSYKIPINGRSRRYISFRQEDNGTTGAVVDVCRDANFNQRVTFRSVLKVHNHLNSPVDVFYSTAGGKGLIGIGRLGERQTLNIQPDAVTKGNGLFFMPVVGHLVSDMLEWKALQRQKRSNQTLSCKSTLISGNAFFIQAVGNVDESIWSDTSTSIFRPCYEIHLKATVVLNNFLPLPLHYLVSDTATEESIPPGGKHQVAQVQLGHYIVLKVNYLDREWTCNELLKFEKRELITWTFRSQDGLDSLNLGIYTKCKDRTYYYTIYCPFWMINNTGKTLTYKVNDDLLTCHLPAMEMPILLCFPSKTIIKIKKKIQIQLEESNWSEDFPIDVAGSSFSVVCESPRGSATHNLGVNIQLGKKGLTKLITFTPSFVVSNVAPFDIQVMEFNPDGSDGENQWADVRSGDMVPIWPKRKEKRVVFRVTSEPYQQTVPLTLNSPSPTLLRLDSVFGGIYVDFQVSESNVCIVCRPYEDGRAPVLLVNRSWRKVNISESKYTGSAFTLEPQQVAYYTWQHPNGSRSLNCSCDEGPGSQTNVLSDDNGVLEVDREKRNWRIETNSDHPMQWISFLHGRQRVLLFTKDSKLIRKLQRADVQDPAIQKTISVSLHGLGVSLVDNVVRREILYTSISSSGIIWETGKYGKKQLQFRRFADQDNTLLEDAYQKYLAGKAKSLHLNPLQDLDGGRIRVDFLNWKTSKPKDSLLRRSYHPGLELVIEISAHRRKLYGRLQRLQVDNQLDDCIFPVAFAPVLPPPSIADQSVPQPFLQCFMVELKGQGKGDTMQIQNLQVRVQECDIRIDKSLASALAKLFTASNKFESDIRLQNAVLLNLDTARQDLRQSISIVSGKAAEHYFGQLSLSPLKIHVSASWDSDGADGPLLNTMIGAVTSLVIKGLTGVQDAVFDLEGFEKSNAFLSWSQLAHDLRWHYVGQAVKNFYVFVFGLDALGNPVGLAKGITRGVEQLITEPFKGAMQGHDEFVEGLALGARNLFGHTVGGMAGAASKITGALGENLAILTFDEDYKKRRRQMMHRQAGTIAENMAQGGKSLLIGVVDGLSGVVISPIKGAIEDGLVGCCCGALKGVVGLFTRPAAAFFDCAHRSLRAFIKKTDPNKSVSRRRPPRFLHPDGVVRPYERCQADGDNLLRTLDDGYYAATDFYVNHAEIGLNSRRILMVTNRRVLFMRRTRFGYWKSKSNFTWSDLKEPPQLYPGGLCFRLQQPKPYTNYLFSRFKVSRDQSGKKSRSVLWKNVWQ